MAWWYNGTSYITTQEFKEHNATEFYNYFYPLNYTINAIAGMLGNIQTESGINPTSEGTGGGGLCGWTPISRIGDWASNLGLDWHNGDTQCLFLDSADDGHGGTHWFGNQYAQEISGLPVTPPVDWINFGASELPADTLALYFMYYYEHPRRDSIENTMQDRMQQALEWYEYLGGVIPPQPSTRKSMPIYMMIRKFI